MRPHRLGLAALVTVIVVVAGGILYDRGHIADAPPHDQVFAFLAATSSGDTSAAAAAWPASICCTREPDAARRADLIRELAARRVGVEHRIDGIEWWSTCCEPRVVQDGSQAGVGLISTTVSDADGNEHELVFVVVATYRSVLDQPGGPSRKQWKLSNVYRAGEAPSGPGAGIAVE